MQSEKWNLNRLDLWAEVALNLLNEAGAVFKGDDSYLAPRPEAAPPAPSVAVKALQMADETFRDLGWHDKYEATTAALAALSAQVQDVATPPIRLPTALSLMVEKGVDPEQNGYCRVIDVEKFLCAKLGREWSATGMSIVSLVEELSAAPAKQEGAHD